MPLSLKVHEYKRANDGSKAVLTRVNPYVMLARGNPEGGSVRVFLQNGMFFHEGGDEYKKHELPDWLSSELAKLTPRIKKEVGFSQEPAKPVEDEDD